MQITSCEIAKTKHIQIYLTEEELEKQEIKELINKYRKEKYSVAIFVSGRENYPDLLEKIVAKQVDFLNSGD